MAQDGSQKWEDRGAFSHLLHHPSNPRETQTYRQAGMYNGHFISRYRKRNRTQHSPFLAVGMTRLQALWLAAFEHGCYNSLMLCLAFLFSIIACTWHYYSTPTARLKAIVKSKWEALGWFSYGHDLPPASEFWSRHAASEVHAEPSSQVSCPLWIDMPSSEIFLFIM